MSVEIYRQRQAKVLADQAIARAKFAVFWCDEARRLIESRPVFFWNGIKDANGQRLQRATYSMASANGFPAPPILVEAKDSSGFSDLVGRCFKVLNDCGRDRFYVVPFHPLYWSVRAAYGAQEARRRVRVRETSR